MKSDSSQKKSMTASYSINELTEAEYLFLVKQLSNLRRFSIDDLSAIEYIALLNHLTKLRARDQARNKVESCIHEYVYVTRHHGDDYYTCVKCRNTDVR